MLKPGLPGHKNIKPKNVLTSDKYTNIQWLSRQSFTLFDKINTRRSSLTFERENFLSNNFVEIKLKKAK